MVMKLLLFLGGFHPEMPKVEAEALDAKVLEEKDRLLVCEIKDWKVLKRLGYSHLILEFLGKVKKGLPFDVKKIRNPYSVRVKNLGYESDSDKKRTELQDMIWGAMKNPKVDLINPKTVIYFFLTKNEVYCGKLLHSFSAVEFSKRDVIYRPFFKPISLTSREARALVNLSGIKKGGKLLDPFCGTGGILLEAGKMGCKIYGGDFDPEMVEGANINLDYFGLKGKIKHCDAKDLDKCWKMKFDAVVTDPPYGISTKIGGREISELYRESLKSIRKVLKKGGTCVLCAPKRIGMKRMISADFRIKKRFEEKVHGSLIREIFVLE